MHQNTYDHDGNAEHYRRMISNIAYRFKFAVIYEDEQVLKVEKDGTVTEIVSSSETPRNTLCWKAWFKLKDEYNYRGD